MIDQQSIFSDKQAIVATAFGSNWVSLGAPGTDVRGDKPPHDVGLSGLAVEARVTEDFNNATSVQAQIVSAPDNGSGAPDTGNAVVHQETIAVPLASLKSGYRFQLGQLPPGITNPWLNVKFVVAGTAPTTGKVTAYTAITPVP